MAQLLMYVEAVEALTPRPPLPQAGAGERPGKQRARRLKGPELEALLERARRE